MRKLVFIDNNPDDHLKMKNLLQGKNYFGTTTYTMYGSLVLDYIEENHSNPDKLPDVIILGMKPAYSEWNFLDRFENLLMRIGKTIKVHLVSSPFDEQYSERYPFVSSFVNISHPQSIINNVLTD